MLAKNCHNGCLLAFCLLLVAALGAAGCQGKVEGQPCGAGQAMCSGACTPVANNAQNCGACGVICAAGQLCQANQCVCSPGLLSCNGSCVASNATHCGSCTTMCTGVEVCSNNTCMASCPTGESQCPDGACVGPTGGDATHGRRRLIRVRAGRPARGHLHERDRHGRQRRHRWRHGDGRQHLGTGGTGGTVPSPAPRCRRSRGGCGACPPSSGGARSRISSACRGAGAEQPRRAGGLRVLRRRDAGRRRELPVRALSGGAERGAARDRVAHRAARALQRYDAGRADACAQTFVATFGKKAFRRPLTDRRGRRT